MKNKPNFFKAISWTWIVIGFLFLGIVYYMVSNYLHEKNTTPAVCSDKKCFTVEIARTPAEQQKGLMNRQDMEENKGMLFVFPKTDLYNFWMKNTLIPLDMVWLDDSFTVVRILTAQPCTQNPCMTYQPQVSAKYVLEINA
jgi:hypothetical protein